MINPITGDTIDVGDLETISDVNNLFLSGFPAGTDGLFICGIALNREFITSSDDIFLLCIETSDGYRMLNMTAYPDFSSQKPMATILFRMPSNNGSFAPVAISDFQKEIALSDIVVEYEIPGESPRR